VVRANASDGDGETIEVATGTHTVGEQAGSAGALSDYVSSIACGDDAPVAGRGPLEVRVGDGDELTCTITNTRRARITVRTVTQPDDPGKVTSFGFTSGLPETPGPIGILLGGLFSLADGDSVSTSVAPGERSVTENNPMPLGYKLIGLSCTEDKAQNSTVSSGAALSTDRNAALVADPGESIVCTFTNRKVVGQAVVVKAGDTFAYHGDSASYTFGVSNTGNSSLHDVQVSDDKCPNVSPAPTSRQNDNGDALLDPAGVDETKPEVWIYTCSYTIAAHAGGETNPVVNTATVTGVDELDRPVGDTDQHTTTLLHPAIALTKTGPATATAGSRVVYTISAKNTGDVAFAAPLVVVTDARCEAPPLLIGTGGDGSPGTLDPGDTWQYACAVQSAAGESVIHNVALVDGTDIHGHHATAQATADTLLAAPRQAVAANVASGDPVVAPASAKLRGPTGCMPRTAKVSVTGKRISQVTFTVDGRSKKIVKQADSAGRFGLSVSRAKLRTGTHRVRARVLFLAGSSATGKTLVMSLNKCRPAVVKPAFTG